MQPFTDEFRETHLVPHEHESFRSGFRRGKIHRAMAGPLPAFGGPTSNGPICRVGLFALWLYSLSFTRVKGSSVFCFSNIRPARGVKKYIFRKKIEKVHRRSHKKRKNFHELSVPVVPAVLETPAIGLGFGSYDDTPPDAKGLRIRRLGEEVPEFRADPADHAAGYEVHNPAVAAIDFGDAGHIWLQE